MFQSQVLWVESTRAYLWRRLRRFVGVPFFFAVFGAGVFGIVQLASWLGYHSAMAVEIVMPTATSLPTDTPLPTATPFQPSSPTAPPDFPTATSTVTATPYREPVPQLIDGLWTYGQDQPMTAEELDGLVGFLNSDPLLMDEDAYYITFLASETAYGAFAQDYGESLQSFLLRHVAWMDREIREADPPVAGGLIARRLIVIADGVWGSDNEERGRDYLAHGLQDSDGSWTFIDPYCPAACAYYDQELRLDFGLMHEWIHTIFKLPDHYALDFHAQYDVYDILAEIPESWRFYSAGERPDISRNDFAMGGSGSTLRRYSALQLAERRARGIVHESGRAWPEMNFLAQVPQSVVWDLGPERAGANVLVYRSQPCPPDYFGSEASLCKILGPVPILKGQLDEQGQIAVGNLFSGYGEIVPHNEGVLFIRVQAGEEILLRWLDIRDFNLAVWEGFGEAAMMRFNLASADDSPENFAWEVEYEQMVASEPFLPD
uniref:Uncharacterized protein n=1 Tax=candidate division WWE3 bacterium TaxID=2053526 RepID=A0A831Z2D7_UNCKA